MYQTSAGADRREKIYITSCNTHTHNLDMIHIILYLVYVYRTCEYNTWGPTCLDQELRTVHVSHCAWYICVCTVAILLHGQSLLQEIKDQPPP